ncbi:hypothetical protein D3C80_1270380 [compost metagenome]
MINHYHCTAANSVSACYDLTSHDVAMTVFPMFDRVDSIGRPHCPLSGIGEPLQITELQNGTRPDLSGEYRCVLFYKIRRSRNALMLWAVTLLYRKFSVLTFFNTSGRLRPLATSNNGPISTDADRQLRLSCCRSRMAKYVRDYFIEVG